MRNMIRQALITNKTLHEKCHNDNAKHRPYNRRDPIEMDDDDDYDKFKDVKCLSCMDDDAVCRSLGVCYDDF